jgi:hypothetical protein
VLHSCCCIYFVMWCGFVLFYFGLENLFEIFFWKQVNKEKKKKKKERIFTFLTWRPDGRWARGLFSPRLSSAGPAQLTSSPVGRASPIQQPHFPFPSLGHWRVGPNRQPCLLLQARNRAGLEHGIHRIKTVFPGISDPIEVSQLYLSSIRTCPSFLFANWVAISP